MLQQSLLRINPSGNVRKRFSLFYRAIILMLDWLGTRQEKQNHNSFGICRHAPTKTTSKFSYAELAVVIKSSGSYRSMQHSLNYPYRLNDNLTNMCNVESCTDIVMRIVGLTGRGRERFCTVCKDQTGIQEQRALPLLNRSEG